MAKGQFRKKRSSESIHLAKMAGEAAGSAEESDMPTPEEVSRVMSMLGRMGGLKGGRARAESLSERRRSLIAKKAAQARWSKEPQ